MAGSQSSRHLYFSCCCCALIGFIDEVLGPHLSFKPDAEVWKIEVENSVVGLVVDHYVTAAA